MTGMDERTTPTRASLAQRLRRACAAAVEPWLPLACIVCGATGRGALCAPCEAALPGGGAPRCPCCGERARAEAATAPCAACAADPPPFERTLVLADYAPPLDRVVHALKFGRDAALARPLGEALARRLPRDDDSRWLVTAVALPAERLAWRGFNQSLEIARALARTRQLPLEHRLLQRSRGGAPASTLHARERRAALAGAFVAPRPLAGRAVLLVDDVMTTGATLRAAAAALRGAGAARVVNCVVARTAQPPA